VAFPPLGVLLGHEVQRQATKQHDPSPPRKPKILGERKIGGAEKSVENRRNTIRPMIPIRTRTPDGFGCTVTKTPRPDHQPSPAGKPTGVIGNISRVGGAVGAVNHACAPMATTVAVHKIAACG